MGDPKQGLMHKFDVRRADGSSEPGGKHHGCAYFVLDMTHDRHAVAALLAYAVSCRAEYPLLADDLQAWAEGNRLMEAHATGIAAQAAAERTEGRETELREKWCPDCGGGGVGPWSLEICLTCHGSGKAKREGRDRP